MLDDLLIKEWNYEKNEFPPEQYMPHSNKSVWWKCSLCGHEWLTTINNRTNGNGCSMCSDKKRIEAYSLTMLKKSGSLEENYPEIARQWDYEQNMNLIPTQVTPKSNRKVWWVCPKGHKYSATISHRVSGSGCPYCAGKRPILGETDLASQYPEIASEWNYEKNGDIIPQNVTKASSKKVWWKGKCGHEWEAAISNRTRQGNGCPYCANQLILEGYNDLQTTNPELIEEWNTVRNGDILPTSVNAGSNKKVWWKGKCGHEWEAPITNRTHQRTGCPYCAHIKLLVGFNDFETLFPEESKNWDYNKNDKMPSQYLGAGKSIVNWKCKTCGYEWKAALDSQAHGHGCPECAKRKIAEKNNQRALIKNGSLQDEYPNIASMWHFEFNNGLKPDEVVSGSGKKVWWKGKCGHSWERIINQMVKNTDCPFCSGNQLLKGFNDLQTMFPKLCDEWNYNRNDKNPSDYYARSNERVWWVCKKCNNEWMAHIGSRVSRESNCPKCAKGKAGVKSRQLAIEKTGTVEELYPDLLSEWDYDKNLFLPSQITPYSDIKVWWLCNKCGRSWKTGIRNRTRVGSRCPSCVSTGTSFPEQAVFFYVRKIFPEAENRYREFVSKGITELDVWIPTIKTAIEYDGQFYHRDKARLEAEKDMQCNSMGIRMIRIKEKTSSKAVNVRKDVISYAYMGISNMGQIDEMINTLLTDLLSVDLTLDFVNVERDKNKILENLRQYERTNSLAMKHPEIANEWHPTKNGKLIPENFSSRNGAKVWWMCSECGNEWRATIASRSAGTGCKLCSNKKSGRTRVKTLIAQNGSLQDTCSNLAEQWHPFKNGGKKPSDYTQWSGDKVWWKCPTCEGEWEAVIASRSGGVGCPYCANIKVLPGFNDLASKAPEIAKDWDWSKNDLRPDEITRYSTKKIWWKCSECGYEWEQKPIYNKFGCSRCVERVSTKRKRDQIVEWRDTHPDKSKKECMEDTGISMPTIKKWWDS